jgi:hypothetical protein
MPPGPTDEGRCTAKDHLRLLSGLTGPVVKGWTGRKVAASPGDSPVATTNGPVSDASTCR